MTHAPAPSDALERNHQQVDRAIAHLIALLGRQAAREDVEGSEIKEPDQ